MSEGYQPDPRTMSFGGWNLFFVLVTVGTVGLIYVYPTPSSTGTALAAVLVVVLEVVYFVIARPSQAGIRADGPRSWAFAAVALVLFTAAAVLSPWASTLLFALTPQIFLLLSARRATAVIVALNLLPLGIRLLSQPQTLLEIAEDIGQTAFVLTFSLFFASRLLNISRQNEERRRLIEQLREREAEVAALSAARGAEAERTRISREMHDTLAQGFASIVTLGHAVQGELDRDPAGARRHVELITETARENLAESRRIIAALAPSQLDGASLSDAIARTVDSWRARTGAAVGLEVSGTPVGTPAGTEVVALRLVQESLENVRKHAAAGQVTVVLSYTPETVQVEVSDDGAGFDETEATAGFGLTGMRSRVAEAGGTLRVASAPGGGTTVRAELPIGGAAR